MSRIDEAVAAQVHGTPARALGQLRADALFRGVLVQEDYISHGLGFPSRAGKPAAIPARRVADRQGPTAATRARGEQAACRHGGKKRYDASGEERSERHERQRAAGYDGYALRARGQGERRDEDGCESGDVLGADRPGSSGTASSSNASTLLRVPRDTMRAPAFRITSAQAFSWPRR